MEAAASVPQSCRQSASLEPLMASDAPEIPMQWFALPVVVLQMPTCTVLVVQATLMSPPQPSSINPARAGCRAGMARRSRL
jgi:hypothetical protein